MADQGKPQYAFFEGRIVPLAEARVGVMTHALHYGTAVFGGLRGYYNDDQQQLYVFRPLDHFERLRQSAALLRMDIPHSDGELLDILTELLQTEGFRETVYIRPLVYKSTEMIGVRLHDVDSAFTMFALPFGRYVEREEGLHVCFSAWQRVSDNAIPARGKISGSYANSSQIKTDAQLAGYDEALVLNQHGYLSEASAANIFVVRRGVVYTPPYTADVLEGIVQRSLVDLLRAELNLDVVERDINRTEVYLADEIFLCGTGIQVAAVTRVEHRPIGDGQMGSITRRIRDLYFDVVHGRVAAYRHWLAPVYRSEASPA